MQLEITINNWKKHNKGETTSWFKVQHTLVIDNKIINLTITEKWLWMTLLCLASQNNSGSSEGLPETCSGSARDLLGICYGSSEDQLRICSGIKKVSLLRKSLKSLENQGLIKVVQQGIYKELERKKEREEEEGSSSIEPLVSEKPVSNNQLNLIPDLVGYPDTELHIITQIPKGLQIFYLEKYASRATLREKIFLAYQKYIALGKTKPFPLYFQDWFQNDFKGPVEKMNTLRLMTNAQR